MRISELSAHARRRAARLGAAACAVIAASAAVAVAAAPEPAREFSIGEYRYSTDRFVEWRLPRRLRELSGLTTDARGRLFGHDDERAVIYEIDFREGALVKRFALGQPPVKGDFEGITWIDGEFYLTTSDGDVYIAREGEDREAVPYRVVRTGLGALCEIEGLDWDPDRRLLLFACKRPRAERLRRHATILAWSLDRGVLDEENTLSLPWRQFEAHLGTRRLQPSGIVRTPRGDALVVVAARQQALVVLERDGSIRFAARLEDAPGTQQMESVALTPDGNLIVGSEGKERGYLRVYGGER
jgi:uncharacterized protein YjiK